MEKATLKPEAQEKSDTFDVSNVIVGNFFYCGICVQTRSCGSRGLRKGWCGDGTLTK